MNDTGSTVKVILGGILVAVGFVLLLYPIIMILSRGAESLFWGILYLVLFIIPAGIIMFVGARVMRKSARVNITQTMGGGESQAVTCPKCGIKYPPGTKFCSECGSKLAK